MPLVAAAVCPHPPLLVPEVAAGAAGELDDLRAACRAAVTHLHAADLLVVVGADATTIRREPPFGGTLAPWGIDRRIGEATDDPLPLSLLIGAWLLEDVNIGNVQFQSIAADASPAECMALGSALTAGGTDVALLVLGDGSACRGEKSPGYDDPRAEAFDTAVAEALAKGDTAALRQLDPGLAAELLVAGRAPWQVLAGAADRPFGTTELLRHEAPYGVAYLVASWR
ncbi:class III extradiol dioxygenase subunit B-like domain-containing protein [Dactylosporangium aurantiacum]|uniref:Class III extradiol dioxygenase subunit B-like domain-containing protein n=1 Tax=Dactylosporangium aurantiacum TaxID=35754 RepID=A0A9Q9MNZ8_9ACTN|nr:class III extradiol dioxygenase subunit B-like domain-containing protein [Dactylosporangium aurantiacum]MDG6104581.1 class III extradiol dioxygenase subunit B-like domain-containing protein [Dactylosporangium aurantiacum]UWZ56187.1 class III extradiol dioxygenase subunit B-like domain-containing protein [Dactylosporangium aurantiacum]